MYQVIFIAVGFVAVIELIIDIVRYTCLCLRFFSFALHIRFEYFKGSHFFQIENEYNTLSLALLRFEGIVELLLSDIFAAPREEVSRKL